jgi:hypothetical protein
MTYSPSDGRDSFPDDSLEFLVRPSDERGFEYVKLKET